MRKITRRNFLKKSSFFIPFILLGKKENLFASENFTQKITVNLPAYSLNLINFVDGNLYNVYGFEVGVGKGRSGRRQTPISEGFIYEKRKQVVFRNRGQIVRWTNTFDERGNPQSYRMPYSKMRGLGMQIKDRKSNNYLIDFVIHSTTDEFTIGTPSSGGCVRLGMEDMLKLYELVAPGIKDGSLRKSIPIEMLYNLVEIDDNSLMIHADVYNRKINYLEEFRNLIKNNNFDENSFDYKKFQEQIADDNKKFEKVHKQILNILLNPFPKNFVPLELKKGLHKKYYLEDFLV